MNTTIQTSRKTEIFRTVAMMLCCLLFVSCFMCANMEVAYCTGNAATTAGDAAAQLEDATTQVVNVIYQTMRKIIAPITAVVFAYAGYQFVLGGNQGTEKARKALFGAVAGLVLVVFAPVLVQAVASAFTGTGSGDLSNFNPF